MDFNPILKTKDSTMPLQWRIIISFFFISYGNIKICEATGTLEITLQSYRFDYGGGKGQTATADPQGKTPLTSLEYVQHYEPKWKLIEMYNVQDEPDVSQTTDVPISSALDWPWIDPTDCQAPTKYRFLICLDYADEFDPSRPCRLQRIQTELMPATRVPFRPPLRRDLITFDILLGTTANDDLIPNPVGIRFDQWKGPLSLAVFVRCCGSVAVVEEQCEEILSTTITTWPRPIVSGKQTLHYAMDGRGSLSFAVNVNCDEDYYGRSCDTYCKVDNPALEHSFCNASTGTKQCLQGWEGLDCQTDTDECTGIICKNGGACINTHGTFTCKCPFSTRGRHCERRYPVCHLQPCQHQGTCLETSAGSMCLCMPGFEGQWCHLLSGQEALIKKAQEVLMANPSTISPIRNNTGSRKSISYTNDINTNEEDALQKTKKNQERSGWKHWYLAIIAAGLLLSLLVLVVIFFTYRSRNHRQYKVNIPANPPEKVAAKPRVFGNAVYQKEDPSQVIQPSSFNIFYESKNFNGLKSNDSAMRNNMNNRQKENNLANDQPSLLDVKALMRKHRCFDHPSDDHEFGFDDRVSLTEQHRKSDPAHYGKRKTTMKAEVAANRASDYSERSGFGYELTNSRRSRNPPHESGYRDPRPFISREALHHYEPQGTMDCAPKSTDSHDDSAKKWSFRSSFHTINWEKNIPESYFRSERNTSTPKVESRKNKSIQYNTPRTNEHSSYGIRDHEYEDINPRADFRPVRPVPKPRHHVKQGLMGTVQIRTSKDSPREEYTNSEPHRGNALYHRRSSDGLISGSTRRSGRTQYDRPNINRGDLRDYQSKSMLNRGNVNVNSPYVFTGDIRMFSSGMNCQHRNEGPSQSKSHNYKDNALGNSRGMGMQWADRSDTLDSDASFNTRMRRSSVDSIRGKLSFRRHSKHQIYRNTDIVGFNATSANKDYGKYRRDSDNFTSGSNFPSASNSPRSEYRRGAGDVVTGKLFGKKRISELRTGSETTIDTSLWRDADDDDVTGDVHDNKTEVNPSSSFV